ncbi:ABC transporter [Segetibacter aerophilus]|uniref:ABC transporter n=1 Tax=Segetibacter aerophilus TaxID=670293 RepID=A0A512BGC1_9BACT|nr:ABC transporter [Segetibacter aerophilus]
MPNAKPATTHAINDPLVEWFIAVLDPIKGNFIKLVTICSVTILLLALARGLLMFLMRQTIIVMSRHIEYDQKNEVFAHYQLLDTNFYKTHSTGDMMNRITEDVSRVRSYTGPAIMYLINLLSLIAFCVINMVRKDPLLTLYVLAPLPILAATIYIVNQIIYKKSEKIQSLLSDLTTNAQESYSGIRVIKSFVQEKAMFGFFEKNSVDYKNNAIGLAKVESIYFPSMALMIGLSTLITILIGGVQALHDTTKVGVIVEFVIYINMLQFPVSAIGWVASMIQRASASQKRLNEFLQTEPSIADKGKAIEHVKGDIVFKDVDFIYPHTGIHAIKKFSLTIKTGEKVLILGKTGSGKSTIAQLLLRFYDAQKGDITIGKVPLQSYSIKNLREQISYVPQDVFLFSDTVANNISFGLEAANHPQEIISKAARQASVENEIMQFAEGYETMVGERGVTLSGGQKQRLSIARGLIKQPEIVVFDDCLSAVDTATENTIISNLYQYLEDKTAIIITHRIFTLLHFDNIVVLEDGKITEQGTHNELMMKNGYYAELYKMQTVQAHTE